MSKQPIPTAIGDMERAIRALPALPPIVAHELDEDGAILTTTLACPTCQSFDLVEIDFDFRWNQALDPEADDRGRKVYVSVRQSDSNYVTLAFMCDECGQVLDFTDIEVSWP